VFIHGLAAARLGDCALCAGMGAPTDVIAGGASTVLINQLPAVRVVLDRTVHGGYVALPGAPKVQIGGPSFSVPANFEIDGDPSFQNKLIRDLFLLSTLPSGQVLLARLASGGKTICFRRGEGNREIEGLSEITITYDPDEFRAQQDPSLAWQPRPPVVGLAHEMVHALGDVEDTAYLPKPLGPTDPAPPPSEPDMAREEARAIGAGSYTGTSPTENSIRAELGLPPRVNHRGRPWTGPTPPDPRPGG
jgi:uncharacterized Zn-binding protein involved in type VI secretion